MSGSLNLEAYLARLGYNGPLDASAATLRALHRAHALSIPFENLDILLGRGVRLDLESVQAKLVTARRGGYCFEQNGLFSAALERLGFRVTRLSARVRFGTTAVLPRTHMVLAVRVDGRDWLADVGYGGWGLLEPVPLEAGASERQGAWTFHLAREDAAWVLRCPECPMGRDQYAFTLEPHLPVDYELGNHFCATHPQSRFVNLLTAQRVAPDVRHILKNTELLTVTAAGVETRGLSGPDEILDVLSSVFGLSVPAGTVFRTPAGVVGAS